MGYTEDFIGGNFGTHPDEGPGGIVGYEVTVAKDVAQLDDLVLVTINSDPEPKQAIEARWFPTGSFQVFPNKGDSGILMFVDEEAPALVGWKPSEVPPPPSGGGGSDVNLVVSSGGPVTSLVVTHNLGKFPSVTLKDSINQEIEAEVTHASVNQLTITLAAATSFTAILN